MSELVLERAPNGFTCVTDPGEPGLGNKRWSVHPVEAKIVAELCRGLDVLEIGTGLGVSTREIARLARSVCTVDIDPWVRENIAATLPKNVRFFSDILDVHGEFGAAFVDGMHSYQQCSLDIKDARRMVRKGGLIIFHDTGMRPVLSAIMDSGLKVAIIETPVGMGMAWND